MKQKLTSIVAEVVGKARIVFDKCWQKVFKYAFTHFCMSSAVDTAIPGDTSGPAERERGGRENILLTCYRNWCKAYDTQSYLSDTEREIVAGDVPIASCYFLPSFSSPLLPLSSIPALLPRQVCPHQIDSNSAGHWDPWLPNIRWNT